MTVTTAALLMLLAVVVSAGITRALPVAVPMPLIQIALGAIIAGLGGFGIKLNPDVFFLLFLPPLLFLDGWQISKEALYRERHGVLAMALLLVFFTVVGVGTFLHWMIPAMPLAVAFALAAVVSPTDPIAVTGIAERVPIPRRLMHILEGESLLNDASGLVCMRFAVAAAVTGSFSPVEALGTFVWLVTGGIAIGVTTTLVMLSAMRRFSLRYGEESGSYILMSLLIPFGAYMLAERIGSSGILAAVSAGIAMSYAEQSGAALSVTRVRRTAVWDMVAFAASGVMFVLLGEQLPKILDGAVRVTRETGHHDPIWLAFYVLALCAALAALRFVWVWAALRLTLSRRLRRGDLMGKPRLRLIAATSLAGVRGAITLAGVLTLPLELADGSPFPARDVAILLAAGTIVVSLVAASVGLPILLKNLQLPPAPSHLREEEHARLTAAGAAITAIEETQRALSAGRTDAPIYADAAARIMSLYRERMSRTALSGDEAQAQRTLDHIERELRLAGLRAERATYNRLARGRELPDDIARRLVRQTDLLEARLTAE